MMSHPRRRRRRAASLRRTKKAARREVQWFQRASRRGRDMGLPMKECGYIHIENVVFFRCTRPG